MVILLLSEDNFWRHNEKTKKATVDVTLKGEIKFSFFFKFKPYFLSEAL